MKKLLRPLLAGAGLAGALVATNRSLRSAPLPRNPFTGRQRRWTWRNHEIFVAEAGDGPPVLLIHGIYAGASSYEYRRLFPLLAERHRVIALDLLGCGLSDRPPLRYTPELFVEQIVDALGTLVDGPTTLVASSLGAAFAIRAAARTADRLSGLAVICPAGLGGILDGPPRAAALAPVIRSPLVGEGLFNALTSRPSLRYFLTHQAYAERASATPEIIEHYYAVAHQPGARYVPAAFVSGALNTNVARDLPFVEAPLLVLWGERTSSIAPLATADEFVRLGRDARLVTFPNSALLPHEEEPEAVRDAIEAFVSSPGSVPDVR